MTQKRVSSPSSLALIFLVCFCAVGAVIVSPAMGDIARHFDIAINQVSQMMSVYLLGYAIGQLIYGPLADRFGRKKALFIGISGALGGVVLCLLGVVLSSFVVFLTGRFIMALGSSASLVVAFIIVNDTTHGKEIRRKMSLLFSSLAVAVPTTTSISGYVQSHFGWAPVFFLFILYSIAMLVLVDYFPETGPKRRGTLSIDLVANRYLLLMSHKKLIHLALMYGCCASVLYVFFTLAPVIVVELLGISPQAFGMMNYIPSLGLLLGTILSAYMVSRRTIQEVIEFGFCLMGAGSLFLLLFSFMKTHQVYSLLAPMFIVFSGLGLIVGNLAALSVATIKDKSYAAALYNFIALGMSVLATMFVGFIPHKVSFGTLTLTVLLALLVMVGIFALDQMKTSQK